MKRSALTTEVETECTTADALHPVSATEGTSAGTSAACMVANGSVSEGVHLPAATVPAAHLPATEAVPPADAMPLALRRGAEADPLCARGALLLARVLVTELAQNPAPAEGLDRIRDLK